MEREPARFLLKLRCGRSSIKLADGRSILNGTPVLLRTRATVRMSERKVRIKLKNAHDPLLDRARNFVDGGDRRCTRAAGSVPQPIDQDRRAVPGRWPLRRPRAHDRPENERGLGPAGRGGEPARREYGAGRP